MKNRRTLITALGAGALTAPFAALAQQPAAPAGPPDKIWRVGFLAPRPIGPLDSDFFGAFPRAMRELGYVEGKNLIIEWRSAEGNPERLPGLAAELVQLKVDAIVAAAPQSVRAAQQATTTIHAGRSGRKWICQKSCAPRRQYHWRLHHDGRYHHEAARHAA